MKGASRLPTREVGAFGQLTRLANNAQIALLKHRDGVEPRPRELAALLKVQQIVRDLQSEDFEPSRGSAYSSATRLHRMAPVAVAAAVVRYESDGDAERIDFGRVEAGIEAALSSAKQDGDVEYAARQFERIAEAGVSGADKLMGSAATRSRWTEPASR